MLAWLALLAVAQPFQEDPLDATRSAIAEGDFRRAVAQLQALPASAETENLWTNLYYRTGAPTLALEHLEAGLGHRPEHLELLHRGASVALWLGDAKLARLYVGRLAKAVEAAELVATARPGWQAAVEDFEERAAALEEDLLTRATALMRARVVALATMVLALGVLVFVGRRSVP